MEIYNNVSAMNAFANGMHISAHNVANVSTDDFASVGFNYGSNAAGQVEVQVKDPVPTQSMEPNPSLPLPGQSPLQDTPPGIINNTVELSREFTQQITAQNSFEANAAVIRTYDEMQRSLYEEVKGPSLISTVV